MKRIILFTGILLSTVSAFASQRNLMDGAPSLVIFSQPRPLGFSGCSGFSLQYVPATETATVSYCASSTANAFSKKKVSMSNSQAREMEAKLAAIQVFPIPNKTFPCPAGYTASWAKTVTDEGENMYTSMLCGNLASHYNGVLRLEDGQLEDLESFLLSL